MEDTERRSSPTDECWSLFTRGNLEEALACYDKVVARTPKNASAWTARGGVLLALGQGDEAVRSCDKAIRLNQDDAAAWLTRGRILLFLGSIREALEDIEMAISLNPKDASAWIDKGNAQILLGQMAKMTKSYHLWPFRGIAEEFATASVSYKKALELNPNDSHAWTYLGTCYIALARYDQAAESYDKAVAVDPTNAAAWSFRALFSATRSLYRDSLESLEMVVSLDPKHASGWNDRGIMLVALGEDAQAVKSFDRALTINDSSWVPWHNRGVALAHMGRHAEALDNYDKAIRKSQGHAPEYTWEARAFSLAKLGRDEEAKQSSDRAQSMVRERRYWQHMQDRLFMILLGCLMGPTMVLAGLILWVTEVRIGRQPLQLPLVLIPLGTALSVLSFISLHRARQKLRTTVARHAQPSASFMPFCPDGAFRIAGCRQNLKLLWKALEAGQWPNVSGPLLIR